jgi:hypothetical protein
MMFVFGGRWRIANGFPNRTGANPETSPVRFVGVVGVPNLVMTPSVGTFQNCRDEGVPNCVDTGHGAMCDGCRRGVPNWTGAKPSTRWSLYPVGVPN